MFGSTCKLRLYLNCVLAPQGLAQNLVARQITRRFVLGIARFETLANSVCPNELNGARHVLLLQLLGFSAYIRTLTTTGM